MTETGTITNLRKITCSLWPDGRYKCAAREPDGECGRRLANSKAREALKHRLESSALQPFQANSDIAVTGAGEQI